jgi:hypothetical protein
MAFASWIFFVFFSQTTSSTHGAVSFDQSSTTKRPDPISYQQPKSITNGDAEHVRFLDRDIDTRILESLEIPFSRVEFQVRSENPTDAIG